MSTTELSFGWIMQPALFHTPAGLDARDIRLAREMIAANERHIARVRAAGFDTIWVEDHLGWAEKAHLECFTNMAWLAGGTPACATARWSAGRRSFWRSLRRAAPWRQ